VTALIAAPVFAEAASGEDARGWWTLVVVREPRVCGWCGHMHTMWISRGGETACAQCDAALARDAAMCQQCGATDGADAACDCAAREAAYEAANLRDE